jgi:L-2-hydroxyglutarate oxidase LhgO
VYYCKGNYFSVAARVPFRHLIYPVPERDGLGVHLTLDMAGAGRFGPDTQWIEGIDYGLDAARGDGFYAAIRTYWPDLRDGALSPSYTGIRPKLAPAGGPATDFTMDGPEVHGVPGLVNLFGIESPGLTASLAIAGEVLARLDG